MAALHDHARMLRARGDFAGAVNVYRAAIQLDPRNAQIMFELGATLGAAGAHDQALATLEKALSLGADPVNVLAGKAEMLHRIGRYEQALEHYDRLLRKMPEFAAVHYNRGKVLVELGRVEDSLAAYQRAIVLRPDMRDALIDLGIVQHRLRRLPEALANLEQAITLDPDHASAYTNLGAALHDSGRFDQALEAYDRAIGIEPGNVPAHNNRAFTLLIQGEFAEGWREMEWRKRSVPPLGVHGAAAPSWTGAEDLRGKRLHVFVEQGLGDVLQFCRLLPRLAERRAEVVFACPASLHGLVSGFDGIELVDEQAVVEADYSLALMSMPGALGIDLGAITGGPPYLHADPERTAAWRRRLGDDGFKIGVAWRTSPLGERLGKGFDLSNLAEIAAIPGVRLISLQKGADEEVRTAANTVPLETLGEDFDSAGGAFSDTAAVMKVVDLVITADTSIAHLAGGLGVPTWVALKHVADWRWLHGRGDTPWYSTLTLFSQPKTDDWPGVFSPMRASLGKLLEKR
ncbi:MAG: repeat-containing protein [Caulobacteraceae bacterium]|nr:repeat-containing protein [Caulobacteraceae bacterium]